MSDLENQQQQEGQVSELDMLKQRAKLMSIPFSNNISVETLKKKIDDALAGNSSDEVDENQQGEDTMTDIDAQNGTSAAGGTSEANPLAMGAASVSYGSAQQNKAVEQPPEQPMTVRQYMHREQMRLVRLRITNLDPKKKELPGEVLTVANEYLGTVKKFVPFGEHTDAGYHVPYCLYQMMKDRKFLSITSTRDPRTGTQRISSRWANEFALEVLEPLSPEEIEQLAMAQIAAGSVDG